MLRVVFFVLSLITIFSSAFAAESGVYRRLVSFEWEAIEEAKSYDIEIIRLTKDEKKGQQLNFKVQQAEWQGPLEPGTYSMRLRARDQRGVPGDWSPFSELAVQLENVNPLYPSPGSKILSSDSKSQKIDFKWKKTPGATSYYVEVTDAQGATLAKEETKDTEFTMELPVAQQYSWKVKALGENDSQSESLAIAQFSLFGPKLAAPEVKKPDSNFVRQLDWSSDEFAKSNDVVVLKLNPQTKKYESQQKFENLTESSLPFDSAWPGGKYQLWIRSNAPLRPSSDISKITFDVKNGDRSPAAEYTTLVRKSIERVTGWYGVASYLITQMQFSGRNPEYNSVAAYSALGGTGRLGFGWAMPESAWGFLGIIDLSGFTFNGKTQTFASTEISGVHKLRLGDRGELRTQVGMFYKELPETIGDPFLASSRTENISFIGPHVGAEYWHSLSPKLGVQLNGHLYYSLMKVQTPNGQDIEPTLSTQFGLMGSFRFSNQFTGLMGYAMRTDNVSYKAAPSPSNFALPGDVNTSTITGHYLNFLAEYNF